MDNHFSTEEAYTQRLRMLIGQRASLFYFMVDELEQAGIDWEPIARRAFFRYGCQRGGSSYSQTEDLQQFAREIVNPFSQKCFEMELTECSAEKAVIDFHHCPLLDAWQKTTDDPERLDLLCDVAMDGDRGVASLYPCFEFTLEQRIAAGDPVCRLVYTKK